MSFLDDLLGRRKVQDNTARIEQEMKPLIQKANARNVAKLKSGQINREQYQNQLTNILGTKKIENKPQARSSFGQSVQPMIGSGLGLISRVPGNLATLAGNAIQDPLGSAVRGVEAVNPINYTIKAFNAVSPVDAPNPFEWRANKLAGGANTAQKAVTPQSVQRNQVKAGQGLETFGKNYDNRVSQIIEGSDFQTSARPGENKLVTGLSSGTGSLGASLLLSRLPGGTALPSTVFGINSAGQNTRQARDAGKSPSEALNIGVQAGVAEAGLEKAGLDKFLGNFGNKGVTNILKNALVEGGQESAQSLAGSGISSQYQDVNWKDAGVQALQEGAMGAILGGGSTAIAGGIQGATNKPQAPLNPTLQSKRNSLEIAQSQAIAQGRPQTAQAIAQQIQEIDNPSPGSLREQIRSVKDTVVGTIKKVTTDPNYVKATDNELYSLTDYGDVIMDSNPQQADGTARNNLTRYARQVADKLGLDILTGSPQEIQSRITDFVEDYKFRANAPQQGGFIGKGDTNPLESLKQEARKYGSAEEFVNGYLGKDGYKIDPNGKLLEQARTNFMNSPEIKPLIDEQKSLAGKAYNGRAEAVRRTQEITDIITNKQPDGIKQQLTDLYNQATQSQPPKSPLTVGKNTNVAKLSKEQSEAVDYFNEATKGLPESSVEKLRVTANELSKSKRRPASIMPDLTNTEGDGIVTKVNSFGREQYLPLLEKYKGKEIVKAGNDIAVHDPSDGSLFVVGLDDSKTIGNRAILEDANTVKNARDYIDWLDKSRAKNPVAPTVGKTDTKGSIKDFMKQKFDPYKKRVITLFEKSNPKTASIVKEATGIDVTDYRHSMDSYAVKHALNKHSSDQIPLKPEHIELAPDIISNPDKVTVNGKTRGGLDAVVYEKRFGDRIIYVEEVRTGRQEMAMTSMYWQKAPKEKSTSTTNPQRTTDSSRALPRQTNDALSVAEATNSSIPDTNTSVKPFTPLSQPVDNIPAVAKQVTKASPKKKQETSLQPTQQIEQPQDTRKTPEKTLTPETKQQVSEKQQPKGKSSVKISSDGRIQNIDEFVKQQVSEQEAKPDKTGRMSKLKRTWIDTLSPAEDNFRQAVKDGKLSQETLDDIIVKNGKSIRSGTAANLNLVESGLVDLLHKKSKEDYDNLGQTLIAIHSKDLRTNGIETGRNASLDEQIVAKYGDQFKADIEQFRNSANYVLDKSVKSQLISKETADMLKKKYPNYVPMNRVMEELESTGSFNSSQIASIGKQTVVRKIKGSKRTVENPLESMISKVQDMSRQSLKNEAALSWVDALKKTGDAKLIDGTVKPGESTISVLRNGNKEIYSVEPEMEAAAKGLTKEQMGTITNAARKVSRVFKTGTTGLNLPFIVTNLARDQQNALLNQSKGELETFKAVPTAIMETLGHGKLYQEAVRNGAVSTSFDLTKPNLKLTAANIRKRGSNLGALSKIEDVVGRSEEYTRVQQYKATKEYWLKKGMSESQAQNKATIAAQQNSADFARAGDLGQILNAWLPYTNAGVQGTRSTLRAAKNNPVRYATKAGAMLVMPTIMTALWNTEDEERKKIYNDISENDKQSSFIIITPWAKKNEEGKWEGIVKIPKPPGISALLYPIEKGVASMNDLDPVGYKDIVKGVLGFASPLGDNLNAAISTVTPQAIKPAVEATINKNLFTNRDIVPYWLKDKPANEQAYKGTSGTARMISGVTGVSPIKVEHMIRGYGGELGLQGLNASDNALNKAGLIPEEQIGGISIPAGFKKRFTEAYDKPGSTIERGTTPGTPTGTTTPKPVAREDGKIAITDKSEKDAKGDYVTRDKYDAIMNAYEKYEKTTNGTSTALGNLSEKYDNAELKKAIDDVKAEAINEFASVGLPTDGIKFDSILARDYASYKKGLVDKDPLSAQKATRSFIVDTYKTRLDDISKSFYTLGDDDMRYELNNGTITKAQMDKIIETDNLLTAEGLQDYMQVGKELRRELGYALVDTGSGKSSYAGKAKSKSTAKGGKAKIDQSAYDSTKSQLDTFKRLDALLAGTRRPVTGGTKKVATRKAVLKKITVRA